MSYNCQILFMGSDETSNNRIERDGPNLQLHRFDSAENLFADWMELFIAYGKVFFLSG